MCDVNGLFTVCGVCGECVVSEMSALLFGVCGLRCVCLSYLVCRVCGYWCVCVSCLVCGVCGLCMVCVVCVVCVE